MPEKKSERLELIIRTAGDGKFDCRSIPCGPCQQIVLRFPNGDSIVFTGEKFSPEEYEKYCGEVERLQAPPALEQPEKKIFK